MFPLERSNLRYSHERAIRTYIRFVFTQRRAAFQLTPTGQRAHPDRTDTLDPSPPIIAGRQGLAHREESQSVGANPT